MPQPGWLSHQKFLETRSPKLGCYHGWFQSWELSAWLADGCPLAVSSKGLSPVMCPYAGSLFLSGHQSDWIKDYTLYWPHFNIITSLKAQFPNTSPSEILEVKASISKLWGSTDLNHTFQISFLTWRSTAYGPRPSRLTGRYWVQTALQLQWHVDQHL